MSTILCRSNPRQKAQGVDRFTLLADLEVQFYRICAGIAHFGDFLAAAYCLTFCHENPSIMRVSAQECIVVFNDDEPTVAAQTRPRVHHPTGRGRPHRRARYRSPYCLVLTRISPRRDRLRAIPSYEPAVPQYLRARRERTETTR